MNLEADVAAELPFLRAQAESMMVDTVTIERPDGTTLDPDSLEEVPAFTTVISIRARVQRPGSLSPRESTAGGFEFGVNTVLVQLPLSATGVLKGDRVTVTSLGSASDPDLLGLVSTVRANLTKTHPTKRTLVCEEVSS